MPTETKSKRRRVKKKAQAAKTPSVPEVLVEPEIRQTTPNEPEVLIIPEVHQAMEVVAEAAGSGRLDLIRPAEVAATKPTLPVTPRVATAKPVLPERVIRESKYVTPRTSSYRSRPTTSTYRPKPKVSAYESKPVRPKTPTNDILMRQQQSAAALFNLSNRRFVAEPKAIAEPKTEPPMIPKEPISIRARSKSPNKSIRAYKIPKKPVETKDKPETEAERRERHQRIAALEASLRALKRTPSPTPREERKEYVYDEPCRKWQRDERTRDERNRGEREGRHRGHHHSEDRHGDDHSRQGDKRGDRNKDNRDKRDRSHYDKSPRDYKRQ